MQRVPKHPSERLIINRQFDDLNPLIFGEQICPPGHRFGPAVRKYVLLHCVLSGKGTYTCGGTVYPVGAGEIFRILPGEETVYQADGQEPWHYCWVGFDGTLARQMEKTPPVFPVSQAIVRAFQATAEQVELSEYRVNALLFRLYDELFAGAQPTETDYVRRVRSYIDAMYMKKICIEELAQQMHLSRRYLTRLFHAQTGMSIRDYLLATRMREAADGLQSGLSVSEAAERCGYEDAFLFSKLFKRHYGVSPLAWKKQITQAGTANKTDEGSVSIQS